MRNHGLFDLYGADRKAAMLTTDALTEGQTLLRAKYPSWGAGTVELSRYVVVRITKTRLVIRHTNAPADSKAHQRRVIVRDGEVQTWAEGGSRYSSSDSFDLLTEDDPKVADIRTRNNAAMVERHVREAAEALSTRGGVKRENVEAMLGALQTWLTQNPATEADEAE